jgi:hypothetical protein
MTSLNCGVEVLCLRAVDTDPTAEHARTYSTEEACIAARDRLLIEHNAARRLALKCVPERSALPYGSERSDLFKIR